MGNTYKDKEMKYIYNKALFEALGITNQYQVEALKEGLSLKGALKFTNSYQVYALKAGASVEDAVKFDNESQVYALKAGASVEDALKFTDWYQVEALKARASVENALKINTDILYKALTDYAKENAGEVKGFFEEHYPNNLYGSFCSGLELLGFDEILGCIKSPSIYDSLISA